MRGIGMLPKIKRCPCCNAINLIKINGVILKNNFKSFSDWSLKTKLNCRKCKVELGLFIGQKSEVEKVVWIDMLKCEDNYLDRLNKLQKNKERYKEKNNELKYTKTVKEIEDVLNQIRVDQIKIKVKTRIQNKNILI